MSGSELRSRPGGFEDRLEAELVTVVTARAAQSGGTARRAAGGRRRPVVAAALLAAGLLAAGAVIVVVVAVAVGFAAGRPSVRLGPGSPSQAVPGGGISPVHIRTAAFSVDSYADGTIHVSWDKSRYIQYRQDIGSLQRALRAAGFPVLIKEGVFCRGPDDNGYLDPSGVGRGVGQVMKAEDGPDGSVVFIFTPSAMPAGEELFIGYLSAAQLAVTHGQPGSVERLVPTGEPLTCTEQAPRPRSRPSGQGGSQP